MSEEKTLEREAPTLSNQDVLEQLKKPEVQESITTLVEQLPKLTEMVTALSKAFDFGKSVATDDVLKSDTAGAIKEVATPVIDTVKNVAATAMEAKDRAEHSHEVIGVFGLMKLLKDPQAQKLLRFINSYLQVANENEKNK
ncbi:MAG TPA: DUF1641 domain-containing protein [Sporolactobacillaceae bacterium]|nr:DUF1641 domain-containing protein [Sporolactobacillaceae bacterium]